MGAGGDRGWWVPRARGRAVWVPHVSRCHGLGGDAGLAEMSPWASRLEQRSLAGLGEGEDVSLTAV